MFENKAEARLLSFRGGKDSTTPVGDEGGFLQLLCNGTLFLPCSL